MQLCYFFITKIRSIKRIFPGKEEGIEIQLEKETLGNFSCRPNIFPLPSYYNFLLIVRFLEFCEGGSSFHGFLF